MRVEKKSGCRMILIEDSEDDALLLQTYMKKEDITPEVLHFMDGESAYTFLNDLLMDEQASASNLVVLDLNLPKMTGGEILERLDLTNKQSSLHVIVFSGSDSSQDKTHCFNYGAKAFFTKPWDVEEYRQFIKGDFLKELRQACPNFKNV